MSRINARIDAALLEKLSALRRLTGKSTSAILKSAVELYFERIAAAETNPAEVFARHGFVGGGDGDSALSSTYKELMQTSLASKGGGTQ